MYFEVVDRMVIERAGGCLLARIYIQINEFEMEKFISRPKSIILLAVNQNVRQSAVEEFCACCFYFNIFVCGGNCQCLDSFAPLFVFFCG